MGGVLKLGPSGLLSPLFFGAHAGRGLTQLCQSRLLLTPSRCPGAEDLGSEPSSRYPTLSACGGKRGWNPRPSRLRQTSRRRQLAPFLISKSYACPGPVLLLQPPLLVFQTFPKQGVAKRIRPCSNLIQSPRRSIRSEAHQSPCVSPLWQQGRLLKPYWLHSSCISPYWQQEVAEALRLIRRGWQL